MSGQKYTHVQELQPEIRTMEAAGKAKREIAEHIGFSSKEIFHNLLKRKRITKATIAVGFSAIGRKEKKVTAELQLHSDQGNQYTSQAYFDLTKEYGITPSMSRQGNCCDNTMTETFFSIIKADCICRHLSAAFDEAGTLSDNYIHFYDHQLIFRFFLVLYHAAVQRLTLTTR